MFILILSKWEDVRILADFQTIHDQFAVLYPYQTWNNIRWLVDQWKWIIFQVQMCQKGVQMCLQDSSNSWEGSKSTGVWVYFQLLYYRAVNFPITASKCFKLKCANHWALLSCKRLSNSENLKRSRCKISSNFANFPLCLTWVLNLSPAGFFKLFPNCFIQSKWMSQHSATTDFTQKLDKMVIKYIDTQHEDIYLR